MSTEIERRVRSLEQKIIASAPHPHPPLLAINPTPDQLQAMEDIARECEICQKGDWSGPAMMVIRIEGMD